MAIAGITQSLSIDNLQQLMVVNGAIWRLLLACLLGGSIGLDREIKRKAAGVRTNLLICMGSAFFTLLSIVLSGDNNPDKSRIASNIVQGIGFLGAGLIIHNRNRVSGLTSAAAVFAVASIGMACGAGLYPAAVAATVIVILALEGVGLLERKANIKLFPQLYELRGVDRELMLESTLAAMDQAGYRLGSIDSDQIGALHRISFSVTTTKTQHEHLRSALLSHAAITALFTFRDPEED